MNEEMKIRRYQNAISKNTRKASERMIELEENYEAVLKQRDDINKSTVKVIEEYQKAIDETMSEKMDLEHNWNELKKWLEERYLRVDSGTDFEIALHMTLDKMQLLEEGGNNDC